MLPETDSERRSSCGNEKRRANAAADAASTKSSAHDRHVQVTERAEVETRRHEEKQG